MEQYIAPLDKKKTKKKKICIQNAYMLVVVVEYHI